MSQQLEPRHWESAQPLERLSGPGANLTDADKLQAQVPSLCYPARRLPFSWGFVQIAGLKPKDS